MFSKTRGLFKHVAKSLSSGKPRQFSSSHHREYPGFVREGEENIEHDDFLHLDQPTTKNIKFSDSYNSDIPPEEKENLKDLGIKPLKEGEEVLAARGDPRSIEDIIAAGGVQGKSPNGKTSVLNHRYKTNNDSALASFSQRYQVAADFGALSSEKENYGKDKVKLGTFNLIVARLRGPKVFGPDETGNSEYPSLYYEHELTPTEKVPIKDVVSITPVKKTPRNTFVFEPTYFNKNTTPEEKKEIREKIYSKKNKI